MLTFGHGRLTREGLATLLTEGGVEAVWDVRRFPGSRTNPAAARGEVESLAGELGIGYRWEERLGGRRSLTARQRAESPDPWWEVAAFRAYAAWTRSEDFQQALAELLTEDTGRAVAVMCSETPWWRCHRRVISDVVVLGAGREVRHLMPGRPPAPHRVSEGARRLDATHLVWDGPG